MRLISQDREIDIPYEAVMLTISERDDGKWVVSSKDIHTGRLLFWLGEYSTEIQAQREMLGPSNLYQQWVAASFFNPSPEPKVYFFGEDLGESVEQKELDFGEKVLMDMAEVIKKNLEEKGE